MSDEIRITAPVTPELLAVLIQTEKFMAQYTGKGARLKDAEHYAAAAIQLEALIKAIVAAQASVSLLGRPQVGARFFAGARSGLMRAVDNASVYLSSVATDLLDKNQLSRYENTNTGAALSHMHALMGTIISDVQAVARQDLSSIAEKSVEILAATADVIAKIDAGDAQGPSNYAKAAAEPTQDDNNANRCPVMLPGKGRCTKRVGHLAGPNQTDCTAN